LETLPPADADSLRSDFLAAQVATRAGVVPSRASAAENHWQRWRDFCISINVDPSLAKISDPVILLQIFAQRYRTGIIAPQGHPVRSRTVEDALRAIGQTFTLLGSSDPRLDHAGNIDFRLQRQLRGYGRADPPPNRVKPVPIQILFHVMAVAFATPSTGNQATADMIALAFFFLLRPGEYTGSPSDTAPFTLQDAQLHVGSQRYSATTIPFASIACATFVTLTFTDQKNGVRGEVIGLGRSGNPTLCPVLSLGRRVSHLRTHNAPPNTPLAVYFDPVSASFQPVKPGDITSSLRASTTYLGPSVGFLPHDISARSLRAAGAMALLCAQVDSDIIRLLGRWRSDEMLRYLHIQAEPVMRHFAERMLRGGTFTLLPNQDVPQHV
jgi:hypothetical protein